MRKFFISTLVLLFAFSAFTGCSDNPSREYDETKDWTAQKFYQEAQEARENANYDAAIDYLNRLEIRFPFSAYAQQAQIEVIYLYYKNDDMVLAVAAADRFIKMNPSHPSLDYVYYIKGLADSKTGESFITKVIGVDRTERCQKSMRQAFYTFRDLVQKFPDSEYAEESKKRMIQLRDGLAKKEADIARFYFERDAYAAAVNRAKFAIENYPNTPYLYDALAVLARSYHKMGMQDMVDNTVAIIKLNYPEHEVLDEIETAQ
ncbi:MAG: outer membrane protein assembly factor BamD [Gammaproteobacteria bacterium]|nr:MAG: outer membrane protein assembly factor BamD [Gammaproteobacteria bacterium]